MSMLWVKALAALALLVAALSGGWIAVKLCSSHRCTRILSLANALAGGFFLGAAILHLLPEAQESLAGFGGSFPWGMVFMLFGFLLILLLERLIIHGHHHGIELATRDNKRPIYPYVLTIVISLHSIIAGYALGGGGTFELILVIFAAEISHKFSAAFALGVSLVRSDVPLARLRRILWLFALMTPIGVVLGELVSARISGDAASLVSGIINAVAAGTFLYVAIVDIIHEEFDSSKDLWPKFGLLITGLLAMGLLAIWV